LYSGVFWDIQNLILEDIDRIEVISGPGGTLWGANAVNGVINIITKSSRDTKGLFAEALVGTSMKGIGSLRYGGQIKENLTYRVFGNGFKMGNTIDSKTGVRVKDEWSTINGGVQLDWDLSEKSSLSLQQSIYKGNPNPYEENPSDKASGDNILVRWNHKASERFNTQLQAYYDNNDRHSRLERVENLKTYDLDWHSKLEAGKWHTLSFGTNLRVMDHKFNSPPSLQFSPANKVLYLYSFFIQDEARLMGDRLKLTLGSKIEHNSYTGFEYQPNARLSFNFAGHQTLWTAASRAVKTPSRLDEDIRLNIEGVGLVFTGGSNFKSETVLAYELGWRSQPAENISFSLSSFYNVYDNIRSAEPPAPPAILPAVTLANGVKGTTYGAEVSTTYQVNNWWNLRAGYTYLKKDLALKPGSIDLNQATAESNDPSNQILIQSNIKFPARLELGTTIRYIDKLPKPYVPDYCGLDLRLGWHLNKALELNLVGQNLLDKRHLEFIPSTPAPRQIERSVYGKLTFRY
jgi:iron complex outermembrane receptor protein